MMNQSLNQSLNLYQSNQWLSDGKPFIYHTTAAMDVYISASCVD